MIRILFSDMDGTLVEEESSWRLVHRFLGTDSMATKALERFSRGEINYEEFVRHDVKLWPRGLPKSFFQSVFSKVRIRQGAKYLFKRLKERKVKRVIVTSGLNLLAERVCKELEADECISNEMVFDEKGLFTGTVIINVDPSKKARVIEDICRKYSIPLNESAAIGDTLYDESMFRVAGLSIFYKKQHDLSEMHGAHYVVNSLEEATELLLNLIEKEKRVK
ncbi:MAG: HAD-IB family phosphatase [Crenarchaeota archaeon]|nr:HAD-IB family phosphatase [Thermoproteota archaeon]MDW8034191.1 HAD-IB family phosphatase [Nitrososphaerota archaeon]